MDTYSIIIIVGIIIISLVLFLATRKLKNEEKHSSKSHINEGTAGTRNL